MIDLDSRKTERKEEEENENVKNLEWPIVKWNEIAWKKRQK